jgi:proton-dependent oligopeptide transporter, POT family
MATMAVENKARKHPKGMPVLFMTEMWERFSFYSMRAIFALYMITPPEYGGLGFSAVLTAQIYGAYVGIVYLTTLMGGFLADRVLGIKRSIIIGGLFMTAGHFLLGMIILTHIVPELEAFTLTFFFGALICLVLGNGLFKPNISTMLGNLYRDVPEKKDDGYNIFYMGINLGAFMSPLVAAYLRGLHPIHGWHYAFSAAGFGMIISMVTFLAFQKYVVSGDILPASKRKKDPDSEKKALADAGDPVKNKQRTMALLLVFVIVIFFWLAFEQQGLTLTFWAQNATNSTLLPETFQAINPMFILLLTFPIVTFWGMRRKKGKEPSTAAKMVLGMLFTALAYAILAVAAFSGGNTGHVNIAWLIVAYAAITSGELMLSPMGLSLVSKLAPPGRLGLMMGGWFVAAGIGGYLSGTVGILWTVVSHSTFFLILVASSTIIALILVSLLKWLNPIIHEAEREAEAKTA